MAKKKTSTALVPVEKKLGRPSAYSDEIALEICQRVADGESIRHITLLEHMPSQSMIYRWLENPENYLFREHYARARVKQADALLEQIKDIAHDGRNDWEIMEADRNNQERIVLNAEHVQRSRLRVDTLKWIMGKLSPKKYGDRIEVEQTGKTRVVFEIGGDVN
jgi:hypothetical protein